VQIPTEPIGSIPRPPPLVEAIAARGGGDPSLDGLYDEAIRDTIRQFEETGSPVITDAEQRKYHNFWTYCVQELPNTLPDGFKIPFSAGHVRRMPRLASDDTTTTRDTAFAKIRSRVVGSAMASEAIGAA
jgi:5-methyltetrahydropteroyltriglutamate--homocysteine methyltransferase